MNGDFRNTRKRAHSVEELFWVNCAISTRAPKADRTEKKSAPGFQSWVVSAVTICGKLTGIDLYSLEFENTRGDQCLPRLGDQSLGSQSEDKCLSI